MRVPAPSGTAGSLVCHRHRPRLVPQPGETEARGRSVAGAAEAASSASVPKPGALAEPEESRERAAARPPPPPPSPPRSLANKCLFSPGKKRSDRGRRGAFHMTCPGTEDVFVNPVSCHFRLFTKGRNHLLLLSPLTPEPPARPPLCRLEEAGKQPGLPSPPARCLSPRRRGEPLRGTPPVRPRICAPAASPGSCREGPGAATKGLGAGGETPALRRPLPGLPEQLAGARGRRRGGAGCCAPRPPSETA